MSLFEEKGVGLVMTDLFVSATAALLIVLAVARPSAPVPTPVQADVIATCKTEDEGNMTFEVSTPERELEATFQLGTAEEFAQSVQMMNLTPSLFYTVAILPLPEQPVSVQCITEFTGRIVREHNRAVSNPDFSELGNRAIFSVIASQTAPADEGEAQ
jgi:hypothetical protein